MNEANVDETMIVVRDPDSRTSSTCYLQSTD
jgi:hypothetical protein